ncbi:MAG: energy transducer TonB [Bacteroidetes bacterium]|nr:energy transducer TonB [Bacteroidota bacterium]
MKASKIIRLFSIVTMFVLVAGISASAASPVLTPADNVYKIIKESIKYPDQAVRESYTGTVDVIFTVDDDGKINVENTLSDSPDIEKIVKEQLSTICCKGVKTPFNEHYKITISFKLIG